MSAVEGLPTPPQPVETAATTARADSLPRLCPYLATVDGNWRSASAAREHRCMAVSPPVQLAQEKQRRLCLVADHLTCATYGAAIGAQTGSTARVAGHSRPIARTTPVILDEGRFVFRTPILRAERVPVQAVLAGILGLAFAAILIARPSEDAGPVGAQGAGSSASAQASAAPPAETAAPPSLTPRPTGDAVSSQPPEVQPTSPPAASQPTTSGATYRVRSGDTLIAIAGRFGTSVEVLVDLNGIADPSRLKVGQVLRLP